MAILLSEATVEDICDELKSRKGHQYVLAVRMKANDGDGFVRFFYDHSDVVEAAGLLQYMKRWSEEIISCDGDHGEDHK